MKYILYNIKELVKKEKIIVIVMFLCILLSSFVLNFTYGLSYNYTVAKANANEDLKQIAVNINQESAPTHRQVQDFVEALSEKTRKNLRFYFSGAYSDYDDESWNILESRFTYINNSYGKSVEVIQAEKNNLMDGTIISSEDEKDGNLVAVVECDKNKTTTELTDEDGYLNLFGKKFEIVGTDTISTVPSIPFLTISDDFVYDDVAILSSSVVFTRSQYEEIQQMADIYMPGAITFPDLPLPDTDSIKLYNNIIIIAVLLSILSVLNFSVLYDFILKKQTHTTAIMRLCGCSRVKIILINIGECILISVPVYVIGTLLYAEILRIIMKKMFAYIADAYDLKIYFVIFVTYFVIMILIMSIVITKQLNEKIIDTWKEGKI